MGVVRQLTDTVRPVPTLAVHGKSPPWPFSTWATLENAQGFRGCRSPHPAATDYFHNLLGQPVDRNSRHTSEPPRFFSRERLPACGGALGALVIAGARPGVECIVSQPDLSSGATICIAADAALNPGPSSELAAFPSRAPTGNTLNTDNPAGS